MSPRNCLLTTLILGATAGPLAAQSRPIGPAQSPLFHLEATSAAPVIDTVDRGIKWWQGGAIGAGVGAGSAMGILYFMARGNCSDCSGIDGKERFLAYGIAAGVGAVLGFIIGGSLADER